MSDQKKTLLSNEGPVVESELSMRDARALVFHLLYAIEAFDYSVSLESVIDNFHRGLDVTIEPQGTIASKTAAIIEERFRLDDQVLPLLAKWKLERLGVVTRLILRIALWELNHTDLPPSIVINEAIELAKCFAEDDAYKFINGVLDEWMKRNRPDALREQSTQEASASTEVESDT